MGFLKRKKRTKNTKNPITVYRPTPSSSSSDEYMKLTNRNNKSNNDNLNTTTTNNNNQLQQTTIHASDTVTVYTDVLDSNDLAYSISTSTSTIGATHTKHPNKTSSLSCSSSNHCNAKNNQRRSWIKRVIGTNGSGIGSGSGKSSNDNPKKKNVKSSIMFSSSTSSLDQRILETEEKVQSEIRKLASASFDDDYGENYNQRRSKNKIKYFGGAYNRKEDGAKEKNRLMTTSGVLLFDGMTEDIPDDRSLQSLIRKERKAALDENNNNNNNNDPNILLTNAKLTAKSPNFLSAPKDYDPVQSGFIHAKNGKCFYDSDYSEDVDADGDDSVGVEKGGEEGAIAGGDNKYGVVGKNKNRHMMKLTNNRSSLSSLPSKKQNASFSGRQLSGGGRQEMYEPAVEVVINENSHLWSL